MQSLRSIGSWWTTSAGGNRIYYCISSFQTIKQTIHTEASKAEQTESYQAQRWITISLPVLTPTIHCQTKTSWNPLHVETFGNQGTSRCGLRTNLRQKVLKPPKKKPPRGLGEKPWKINRWNLTITCLKRKIIFQTFIFGFHVNFSGV